MPLKEHLIELTEKSLVACRECHVIADVSMTGSNVKMICPNCHETLGIWETSAEASADLTAYIASDSQGATGE